MSMSESKVQHLCSCSDVVPGWRSRGDDKEPHRGRAHVPGHASRQVLRRLQLLSEALQGGQVPKQGELLYNYLSVL